MTNDKYAGSNGPLRADNYLKTHNPAPLTTGPMLKLEDGSEEWEYEYSTTETEIYYVTLDLTLPKIIRPSQKMTKKSNGKPKKGAKGGEDGEDEESNEEDSESEEEEQQERGNDEKVDSGDDAEEEEDGDDLKKLFNRDARGTKDADGREIRTMWTNPGMSHGPGHGRGKRKRKPGETWDQFEKEHGEDNDVSDDHEDVDPVSERQTSFQINGLHTPNPMVSYGGSLFQCNWTSNLGTEFLFVDRSPENPLPAIQYLPDEVDLLAMSSARIMSERVGPVPVPKSSSTVTAQHEQLAGSSVTVGRNYLHTSTRKKAAPFLQQMATIKRHKGEGDEVTLVAKGIDATKPTIWFSQLQRKRTEEKNALEQKLLLETDETEIQSIRMRLEEINTDLTPIEKKKTGPKSKPKAAPRKRARKTRFVESDEDAWMEEEDDEYDEAIAAQFDDNPLADDDDDDDDDG